MSIEKPSIFQRAKTALFTREGMAERVSTLEQELSTLRESNRMMGEQLEGKCEPLAHVFDALRLDQAQRGAVVRGDASCIESEIARRSQSAAESAVSQRLAAVFTVLQLTPEQRATVIGGDVQALEKAIAGRIAHATEEKLSPVFAVLQFSPEQRTAVMAGDSAALHAGMERLAMQKAVNLAASQGTPPVPAMQADENSETEILEAFQTAADEPDPQKRATLFAKASKRFFRST